MPAENQEPCDDHLGKLGQSAGRYAQLTGGLLLAGIAEYGCLF